MHLDERFKHIDTNNIKINNIINNAYEEFSKNTYKKASTNNIVKKAGISRGLLYHYFKDKEELYEFLLDYAQATISQALSKELNWDEQDIFNRIKQASHVKARVSLKYPYMLSFYVFAFKDRDNTKAKQKVSEYVNTIESDFYTKNVDFTMFKSGVDIEKAMNVVKWTLAKLGEDFKRDIMKDNEMNLEEYLKNSDEYIDFLRETFYK